MLEFLQKYGGNVHSQNGEDLLIEEALRRLGLKSGIVCEIGAADGKWMSNSRYLIEQGWSGVLVETQWSLWKESSDFYADNPKVKSICSHADQYNINAFIKDDCDVVSFDTDGSDFRLFQAMKAKPKVVIIEVDSSVLPDRDEFNADGGAGYLPMLRLAISKGYFLLCHSGNEILVDNKYRDLFPEIVGDGVSNSELYFNRSWVKE